MASIRFDKGEYNAGEEVAISYNTLGAYLSLRMKNPSGIGLFDKTVRRKGAYKYILSGTAPLGTYKAELYTFNPRTKVETIYATATMKVVSGVPVTPPAEGETKELDLGDYEVTWTSSGYDTLKAEIRVIDTGVTCLSVLTGMGVCDSSTPPGVTIIGFTVTGYLKSTVAPPPVSIGSWIDESGVANLTPSHAIYVYYLSQGATGAADTKYAGLSPKPSRLDASIATVDNALGIFFYSQGAMGAGNAKTGLNY